MAGLRFKTYAENMRVAAKERQIWTAQLAEMVPYGKEHIRRILKGEQKNVSRDCNDDLCLALGLDADEMFALLEREKLAEKYGYVPPQMVDPIGQELMEIWEDLTEDEKRVGVRMLKGLAAERLLAAS